MRLPIRGSKPADVARRCARFHQEARFCAQLHHPNIVRLIDSGQTDDGTLLHQSSSSCPATTWRRCSAEEIAARSARGAVPDAPGPRRPRLRPRAERGPPRSQAEQHHDRPHRRAAKRAGARLRHRRGHRTGPPWRASTRKLTPSNEIRVHARVRRAGAAPRTSRRRARSDLYAWGLVFLECLTRQARRSTGRSVARGRLQAGSAAEPIPIPPALPRAPARRPPPPRDRQDHVRARRHGGVAPRASSRPATCPGFAPTRAIAAWAGRPRTRRRL